MPIEECGICGSEEIDDSAVVASDPISGPVGYQKCRNCGAKNDVDDGSRGWYKDED